MIMIMTIRTNLQFKKLPRAKLYNKGKKLVEVAIILTYLKGK